MMGRSKLRTAVTGVTTVVVRYLLVFLLCAILWRILYIIRPCLGDMPGWKSPPACSIATLMHRATVPGPTADVHYLAVAVVAFLIVVMWLLLGLARAARLSMPRLPAFIVLLTSIAVPCVSLAWLLALVRPCLLDLLESPYFLVMCFALRDRLTDTPSNPVVFGFVALLVAIAITVLLWRRDRLSTA
jgi:hypothetical protein